jgi:tetratricopeptide (TPR) repeat protein
MTMALQRISQVAAALVLASSALVELGSLARAQAPSIDAIWNDPAFKQAFIAGYGVNSDIEPRILKEEVAILEKVLPLMSSDLAKAEETLKKAMKPDCSAILDYQLGGVYFQQDKFDDALASNQIAVKKFPNFRRAWRNIGLIEMQRASHDGAIKAFTKMIELGGADAYGYGLLGFAYAAKLDYQPAEAAYRTALLLQPENLEWRLGLTQCVFKQDKYEEAGAMLDGLIARFPHKPDFWLLQAHTFLGRKLPLRAAENLELLDKLGKASADTLQTLGDIYLTEGLADLAARAYGRSLEVDPQQPLAKSVRAAEALAARGAPEQARALTASLKKARGAALPDDEKKKILKLESRLAMADGGGGPEAVLVLEEILRLDPLDGEALLLLGQHYGRNGEPDRAIFYYERASGIEACEGESKLRHAQLLAQQGRFLESLPLLRRAQEIKPRDELARYIEQVERAVKSQK